ncbi:MAG: PLP-dependent aminotransferase family protein [Acidobacteriota bacterium]
MPFPNPDLPLSRWTPAVLDRPGPTYAVICDVLGEAITTGELLPGTRLPSHRDLARRLGVAVGTVTRAYKEALRRGLVRGDVGRGTFVRERPPDPPGMRHYPHPDRPLLDLYKNHPLSVPAIEKRAWAEACSALAERDDLVEIMGTAWSVLPARSSRIGADWLRLLGLDSSPDDVVDCPGLQGAVAGALATITSPGDVLATAELTFPVVSSLAERHGLSVHGLETDGDGILPEAFEDLCHHARPTILYLEPDLHAPTTAILSESRRCRLAELASEHDVWILEFVSSGILLADPPPRMAALAPDRTFLLADVCHGLSVGLRSVFVVAPPAHRTALLTAVASVSGTTPVLTTEIVGHWLDHGVADALIAARRTELAKRHALAADIFSSIGVDGGSSATGRLLGHPAAHNLWLELPSRWSGPAFVDAAERRGVAITDGAWFAVGDHAPAAVRLCLGNLADHEELADALGIVAELLDRPSPTRRAPVL